MSMATLSQSENTRQDGDGELEFWEDDQLEQCKELEDIYNKLVITKKKVNYGPPVYRTLVPGAHARKLGIRLKTAKQLSEKSQTSATSRRLKTADPRLVIRNSTSQESIEDIEITPLLTEQTPRERKVLTALNLKPSLLGPKPMVSRKGTKSAPPARAWDLKQITERTAAETCRPVTSSIPAYSSLAMYSPQTQRFTIEQLALEQSRILKRLSHIQSHRVDKGFFVSGAPCDIQERFNIDEEQYKLLMEITNRGKQTNKKVGGLKLSRSILQHFTPQSQAAKSDHLKTVHTLSLTQRQSKSQGPAKRVKSLTSHPSTAPTATKQDKVGFKDAVGGKPASNRKPMTPESERRGVSPVEFTAMSNLPAEATENNCVEELPAQHTGEHVTASGDERVVTADSEAQPPTNIASEDVEIRADAEDSHIKPPTADSNQNKESQPENSLPPLSPNIERNEDAEAVITPPDK